MNLSSVSKILVGSIIVFRHPDRRGVLAEAVDSHVFSWNGERWEVSELWVPSHPELAKTRGCIKPEEVIEILTSSHIPLEDTELPPPPKWKTGDKVWFKWSGLQYGTIGKIEFFTGEYGGLRYEIEEHPERESCTEKQIIGKEAP